MATDNAERARWKELRGPGREAAAPDDFDLDKDEPHDTRATGT